MKSEHFPLRPPWHWHDAFGRKDGKGEPLACGDDTLHGQLPMGQCSHFSFAVSDDKGFVIAKCSNALVTMSSDLSEDHARLIAAAPSLLEALRSIAGAPPGAIGWALAQEARAALEKI